MKRVVILAAGDFPKKGSEAERLLLSAETVIACDSAACAYRAEMKRDADYVIGDFDSLPDAALYGENVIHDGDQDTNDLTKAIRFALDTLHASPNSLVIVGATGKREDHSIGNVFRALDFSVRVVTDDGEFVPVRRSVFLKTWRDNGVSVFVSDSTARMTSRGLRWPLDGVVFSNPYVATLNRAANEWITVRSDKPAFVYLASNPAAVRAVVALGSNLGDRAAYLHQALRTLKRLPDTRLVEASSIIETEGVEVPSEFSDMKYFNQVALFETTLSAWEFSRRMHEIEDRLGRVRTERNGPRTIDIDLISFGNVEMSTPELTLPHPRAHLRDFVLSPMKELGLTLG